MTSPTSNLSHPKYRPDIDGLRAIAVLSVIAFHAFPSWIKGGFIGVDIFYVISGFLISTIIFENLDKGTFRFTEFYARRIKRIFPALLFVLLVTLAFGWVALLTDEYKQLAKHTMAGIGFVSNFVLLSESGYFDNAAETKPLLHLWSLGIEEQFYILWPVICCIMWRLKKRIIYIIFVLILCSFLLNVRTVEHDNIEAFFSPFTRFWELLSGAILAQINHNYQKKISAIHHTRLVASSISFVGFLFLAIGFFFIDEYKSFPGYKALVPVIGTTLIILSGTNSYFNRLLLTNKFAVYIGLISFPLYLWHWPILSFMRIVERGMPDKYLRLLAILLSLTLAWITFHFIEKKIRTSRSNDYILGLVTICVLIFGSAFLVYFQNGVPERKAVTTSEFSERVQYQFMGPIWSYTKNEMCLNEYKYKDQETLQWWFCMKSTKNPPTILLLGNSFANQLYPGFVNNFKLSHHTVLSIGTCSIGVDGTDENPRSPCYRSRAKEQSDFIDQIIKRTPSLKYVILDGLERNPSKEYISRVLERMFFLEKQGLQVIVFVPHIKPGFHPKACFRSPLKQNSRNCLIPSSERKRIINDFSPLINSIKISGLKFLVFDQNDVFCDRNDGNCSFVRDGLPLHRDEVHISEYASILLQGYFNEWARDAIPAVFEP